MMYVAIDLGASSGRVILGRLHPGQLEWTELHRFANCPRTSAGHLRWDAQALFHGIKTGLRALPDRGRAVRSIGVDTWGVDYGLIDRQGRLLEDPVCYRDPRTQGLPAQVLARLPADQLFQRTGVQIQPFNTLYQLAAQMQGGALPAGAARLLLMPDLCHHFLCGSVHSELTIASTTQMLSASTRQWDQPLLESLGLPCGLLPDLAPPGTRLGVLRAALQHELGLEALPVVTPAAHDTASAVAGTPLLPGSAFVSSGTWSLVGIETAAPLLTEGVRIVNLTNEAGASGTNRLLQNVMGLWILESCRRSWEQRKLALSHEELLQRLPSLPAFPGFVWPDDPRFFNPDDMVVAVQNALHDTGQTASDDPAVVTKVILVSLAMRYAEVLRDLERVTGRRVQRVHIIGGGSQNAFLNQATADATGLEVIAGPVEATAIGNILVQTIADRRFADLAQARAYVRAALPARHYRPTQHDAWQAAWPDYERVRPRS